MRVCPHCELPTVEAGSFCPSCGKPLPVQEARPQQALMGTFRFPPAPTATPAGKAPGGPAAAVGPPVRPVITNVGPAVAASPPRLGSSAMISPPASGSTVGPRGGSSAMIAPPAGSVAGPASGPAAGSAGAAQGSVIRPRNVPSPAPMQRIEPMDAALVPAGSPTADSIAIPDPRNALLGVIVDGFAIDSILGSGGCGTVYRGRQVGLDRPVAIKVPTFDVVDDPVLKKRFLREARAAARVRHPSVVTIYGVGEVPDGRPYLAMELLEGVSLLQVLDDGPLPVERALGLARQIALALAETHAAGVVHRDLKPSNIIWRRDRSGADRITIVDFGIAAGQQGSADATRLTAGGKVIGTPHYMAPEQAQGEHQDIDHRTDLYALGCVLFELLTNDVPFDGTGFDVVLAHMAKQPEAPSKRLAGIPPQVDELVLQLMRKRPEERPASAEEVVKRIDAVLHAVQAAAALAPPRREGPRVPTAPATAATATDLVMATEDTAAEMAAGEAPAGGARAAADSGLVSESGWPVGYAAPEAAHRDERSGRAERTSGRGRDGGEGRGDQAGEKASGGRGATSAGVGAASTMLAVAKVTPPRQEQQSQPQLGKGPATRSEPQMGGGHAVAASQLGGGHSASTPATPSQPQHPATPSQPQLTGQAAGQSRDGQGLGVASTVPQMADRYNPTTPPSQPPGPAQQSHGTMPGAAGVAHPTRPGTLAPGQTGMAPRRTHQLSSAALARRRQRRWKLAAVAMVVCLAAALVGIGVQRMLPGRPESPAKSDGATQTILLTSDELSMRMTAPAVLRANQQVRVRMEIWDGDGEPLDTRLVVTIEAPDGKAIGLKATAVTSGVYEFVQDFATAGKNVVTVYPETTDATFEAPFEVIAEGDRNAP